MANPSVAASADDNVTTKVKLPPFSHLNVTFPTPGVCHCALNRPPVNAFNTGLWTDLLTLLTHLETYFFPHHIRSLIISSALDRPLFSAGNDLRELHAPSTSAHRFRTFWLATTTFLSRLYCSPLYTVIALRGLAPAAACALALCCDERIALDDTRLGLTEVTIGLAVPPFWAKLLLQTSSSRASAERALAAGLLLDAHTAKQLHLIDNVVQGSCTNLSVVANQAAQHAAKSPPELARARAMTKHAVRAQFAKQWECGADAEARGAWEVLRVPNVAARVGEAGGRRRRARM